eukprot:2209535-Alexandrium_andersonii.AAC.1
MEDLGRRSLALGDHWSNSSLGAHGLFPPSCSYGPFAFAGVQASPWEIRSWRILDLSHVPLCPACTRTASLF